MATLIDGDVSPLEAMCRAMRDSEPGMEGKHWQYWLPAARAALLALTECELPESIPFGNSGNSIVCNLQTFREVLRAIATPAPENSPPG